MKKLLSLIFAPLLVLAASCSGSKEFRIDVRSDDIGTQNVTVFITEGETYRTETVSAIDGQFSLQGTVECPVLVEVFTSGGSLLGEFIMEGGDHIEARLSALNPENISIDGNSEARMLNDFIDENRKAIAENDADALNRAVEKFVRDEPDRFVSAVLLTRYFTVEGYEEQALELLQLIPEKYRPMNFSRGFEEMLNTALASDTTLVSSIRGFTTADTARIYTPAGAAWNALMLTDNDSRGADSIRKALEVMNNGNKPGLLRVTDLGCDRDTMLWHSALRSLPADYPAGVERLWLPAGAATEGVAGAAPSTVPYFILTDSVGHILYRGPSATAMRAALGNLRRKN